MFRDLPTAVYPVDQRDGKRGFSLIAAIAAMAVMIMGLPTTAGAVDGQMLKRLKIMKKCELCDLAGSDLRRISLARANLAGANLTGANLEGTDLSRANLRGAKLDGANLKDAKLRYADLRGARLNNAILIGANLEGARLERAWLRKADLRNARLLRTRLTGATLLGADLRDTDLTRTNLDKVILREVNFGGATLQRRRFVGVNISGANFSNAHLQQAVFSGAKLIGAKFIGANLSGARLDKIDAQNAQFADADLTGAILTDAKLSGADFTGAHLVKANLANAELMGATLVKADLTQANLRNAQMTGAKSSSALFIESDLRHASLLSADLSKADFSKANMGKANLGAANLHEASLEGANMANADLRFADLQNSRTKGASFAGADLRGTKVSKEDLLLADVGQAKLDRDLMAALNPAPQKKQARSQGAAPSSTDAQEPDFIAAKIEKTGLSAALIDIAMIPPSSDEKPRARINWLHHAGDGSHRLFVADMRGKIHILKNGRVLDTPFLDMAAVRGDKFFTDHFENGLSTFAFHPDYGKSGQPGFGKFYTVHTETSGPPEGSPPPRIFTSPIKQVVMDDVLMEWTVDQRNPDRIVPDSRREIIRIREPHRGHNMGLLAFNPNAKPGGPDYGLLYIGIGDGGDTVYSGVIDAQKVAQNRATPFGAILRINPLASDQLPYTIPGDNPFVGKQGYLPEMWAYGLRNPIRFSWDRGGNGKMIISDVGQAGIEEINLGAAGANYGWSEREGTFKVDPKDQHSLLPLPQDDRKNRFTYPVAQYDHNDGNAVIGGFVYRGGQIPDLRGMYLFGDIVAGRIFYVSAKSLVFGRQAKISELTLYYNGQPKTLLDVMGGEERADLRFGMGEDGEIYVLTKRDGVIRKLQPMTAPQSNR